LLTSATEMTGLSETAVRHPAVTIVIPNWNGRSWLPDCLHSVYDQHYRDFQVFLVDNASTDDSVSWVREHYSQITVIEMPENTGFARAVNTGIQKSESRYVALLNTDTRVDGNWLQLLVRSLEETSSDIGAVSPLMLSLKDPGYIDDAGDELTWYGEARKYGNGKERDQVDLRRDIFSPCAGAALYRRDFFKTCGLFDEGFFAYLEDVDLGLRGQLLGYRYLLVPDAVVYHQSHGSAIDYHLYIRLVTQNRLLVFLKNIPAILLWKHCLKILYGQLYYLLAFGHWRPSLAGYAGFFRRSPEALRARRTILKKKTIDNRAIDQLLLLKKPDKGIWYHFKKLGKFI
jgi:GT2 family glycosyltransferase